MNDEEIKAIEYFKDDISYLEEELKRPNFEGRYITIRSAELEKLKVLLNLIEKQKAEIEKKYKIQKEVAEEIDNVAVELSKLTDNIFIINQAMKLQKIAEEKLGKFYID